jgi:hypothetical protein
MSDKKVFSAHAYFMETPSFSGRGNTSRKQKTKMLPNKRAGGKK